jgi:ergothioneine biosynthesis protein EgtB
MLTHADLALRDRFAAVRAHSVALAAPLSAEDCVAQSMPDASPVKWHLAHTSWFFETFVLEPHEPHFFRPHHAAFRVLYNSYYNGVGDKFSRPQRGLVTRPSLAEILAYRAAVDARMQKLLARDPAPEILALVELGLNHEEQHQELILTDVLHLLSINPLSPAYDEDFFAAPPSSGPVSWRNFEGGVVEIGADPSDRAAFDNEAPRHRQFLEPFALSSRLVTNGEYAAFIADGGYRDAALWLSEGWDFIAANQIAAPLYWRDVDGVAHEFSLAGLHMLDLSAAVRHISFFEAAAYASWAGARLPTEAEWELAAVTAPLPDMFGTVWQWTSSSYAPYPGFVPPAGAIGEYNGKFMVNQYVLRGSSLATPGAARATYRNFFPTGTRWQFTGLRLAR